LARPPHGLLYPLLYIPLLGTRNNGGISLPPAISLVGLTGFEPATT